MAQQAMIDMSPLEKMERQRIINDREKFESRFAKLTIELNLSPEQQAKIRAAMKKFVKKVGADGMQDLSEQMKMGGLDEATAAALSEEQKTSFAAIKAKERQNWIDSKVLKSLPDLAPVLDLNEQQKDAVYGFLSEQAAKQQDGEGGASLRAMGYSELPDSILEQLVRPDDFKKRNDERVEAMRPVLDERQLQQYRTYLEKPIGEVIFTKTEMRNPGK